MEELASIGVRHEAMFVGGQAVKGSLPVDEVINPADGSVVGTVPVADDDVVGQAVEAAAAAFSAWAATPATERAELLLRMAAWAERRSADLARLITLEQGKPLSESSSEVAQAVRSFRYYAAEATRTYGEVIPTSSRTLRSSVVYQPLGVAVCIAGWNYPLGLMCWKVAPALAAGCTVVAKPSAKTPLATLAMLAGASAECGLPSGALNVVTGPGGMVGHALVTHPLVRKVSLTGSVATGQQVLSWAAPLLKRVTLELGGQCPMIVAPDAPLELAVHDGVRRAFRNAGQLCNSVNRIYVHEAVAEPFVDEFVRATRDMTLGPGLSSPEPSLGPLTTLEGLERVDRHVEDARSRGGTIATGGRRPLEGGNSKGLFYEPTVVVGANDDMLMCQEETFGPVAPIVVVEGLDEAFQRANALEYGLVAYLYTRDLRTANLGAERLEFGTVNINNVGGGDVPYPYAGWKQSGLGVELSHQGMREYLAVKHIRAELGYGPVADGGPAGR